MKNLDTVAAIENLWEEYGSQWPPRPCFQGWPHSWREYQEVCDVMPEKLHSGMSPCEFREWLTDELNQRVCLDEVMEEVKKHWSKSDRNLLGFFGCLTFLKNAYRWGALPARQEERERQTLQFPEIFDRPLLEIARLYGVAPYGHIFSLKVANAVYENDKPVAMRFHFNNDPKIQKSEENFFLSFVDVENVFQEAVSHIREFLLLTKEAESDGRMAVRHFSRRAGLLEEVRSVLVKASKVFSYFTQGDRINKEDWGRFVQSAATWGLDGKGGASGGETFIFQLLDEFLHIPGKCLMYKTKPLRREHMPEGLCDILYSFGNSDHKKRFDSFIGLDQSADPIWKLRDELVKTLHLWRLSHAHVVRRFLTASGGLATTLEKKMDLENGLALTTEKELLERARETIGKRVIVSQAKTPVVKSEAEKVGVPFMHGVLGTVNTFVHSMANYYLSWIG